MIQFIRKYGQILAGFIFLLYFVYSFSNAIDISITVVISTCFTIVLYAQSVGEFFYFFKKNGRPRLQDWFKVALFFTLILDFLSLVNKGKINVNIITTSVSLQDAFLALFVIFIVYIVLDVSYFFMNGVKKRLLFKLDYKITIKHKWTIFSIYIIAVIIQFYLYKIGFLGFGVTHTKNIGIISLISMLVKILVFFSLILCLYTIFIEHYNNKIYKSIFYFFYIMQIFNGMLSGMKENALAPVFYFIIIYLLSGRHIPRSIILFGTICILLLYPFNSMYRNITSAYPNISPAIKIGLTYELIKNDNILDLLNKGSKDYSKREDMFSFFEYAVNNENKWKYFKHMNRYIYIPISFLPRLIVPSKPLANIGAEYYKFITGIKTLTSVTPTTIGWMYLEGGMVYVIIISFLLGLIFEYFDRANIQNPFYLLIYVLLLQKNVKPEWDPYFLSTSLIMYMIIYFILLKFVGLRKIKYEN